MEASEFDRISNQILSSFEVRYVDFDNPELRPYKDRKIGGVVRIDTGEIMIDKNLSETEEDRTWVHRNRARKTACFSWRRNCSSSLTCLKNIVIIYMKWKKK